ncbi:Zn-dependent hydrolase [Alteromonadales bacterium alter-6D02]|nr:Zn-dependent hydrolase [Alteromonadales bacterium alter-6D02]
MMKKTPLALLVAAMTTLVACNDSATTQKAEPTTAPQKVVTTLLPEFNDRLDIYHQVTLNTDLSHLSDNQKAMLGKLIDVAEIMDDLFWKQSFGEDKSSFLAKIDNEKVRQFAEINYGPWDRLDADKPFLSGYSEKALGAQFYPQDITKQQLQQAEQSIDATGLYSVIRRDKSGNLVSIPYSIMYKKELKAASKLLLEAAALADDKEFANYLTMRSQAFLSDNYQASDFAWMDMKNNPIDVVIGPIETYEDQLVGYRSAFEAYVLVKDQAWSERLAKFASFLPALQKGLPVDNKFKQETPGTDADLNAYDVIYYAGHSNAGGKTIAINLPNDEQVQLEKGTRRLQLKNAMQAKFDHILAPIATVLIAPEQQKHVTFDAFFANTMFHEVAHGLGIKNTINDKGTVRQALKEHASALEEGKADILGLYMIAELFKQGQISEGTIEDNYVTFMAGIFRSVRFGAASAHGKANMMRFNYFQQEGAFERDAQGLYRVNINKMTQAMTSLSQLILTIQGTGDYAKVDQLIKEQGLIKPQLAADLAKLEAAAIPVDIDFKQGKEVLGL